MTLRSVPGFYWEGSVNLGKSTVSSLPCLSAKANSETSWSLVIVPSLPQITAGTQQLAVRQFFGVLSDLKQIQTYKALVVAQDFLFSYYK